MVAYFLFFSGTFFFTCSYAKNPYNETGATKGVDNLIMRFLRLLVGFPIKMQSAIYLDD